MKNLASAFDFRATGGATSTGPSATSGPQFSVENVDEAKGKHAKLSSYFVDPTAAYDMSDWASTAGATARLAIDILKESSDACGPLKSVVGGLSTILMYYDVRFTCFSKPHTPLTFDTANDGEP